jgi:hypothetical protein
MNTRQKYERFLSGTLLSALLVLAASTSAFAGDSSLDELLNRTSKQVAAFVDQFSSVKCTERVTQEKLGENEKVERKAESAYDYLVILTNAGGELTLDESRLALEDAKHAKKQKNQSTPLLVSNGFATLFLIFHPYYTNNFQFAELGEEIVNGRRLVKVHFEHIRNTRSVAALAVRGREYPLDLAGTAWIDPATGNLAKVTAGIDQGVEDIGMKSMHSEVEFAPVRFGTDESSSWFPTHAVVEVQTQRQHWRNTHVFTDYKQFSVSTEEQVAKQ